MSIILPNHIYCLWLTGLSGSGKSTAANQLKTHFETQGQKCIILDGDIIRGGLSRDLGYSTDDRNENIRRVSEVARLLVDAGILVIVASISPLREQRELARSIFQSGQFIEIYLCAPLAECELRDAKGLYVKARRGEIKDFTGVDSPYEPPLAPQVTIDTSAVSGEDAVSKILDFLKLLETESKLID